MSDVTFRELEDEFLIADLGTIERRLERISTEQKKGKKIGGSEKELLEACLEVLNAETPLRMHPELATAPELRGFTLLSAKPVLVIVNNADEDDTLPELSSPEVETMVVRGKLEMEMTQLSEAEADAFRQDFGLADSALDRVIKRSFALLQLATFFTVGDDEVKAWTIARQFTRHGSGRSGSQRHAEGFHPGRSGGLRRPAPNRGLCRRPQTGSRPAGRKNLSRQGRRYHQFPFQRVKQALRSRLPALLVVGSRQWLSKDNSFTTKSTKNTK